MCSWEPLQPESTRCPSVAEEALRTALALWGTGDVLRLVATGPQLHVDTTVLL